MKLYYDNDASLDVLKGKKIAVIGFGSQGHAHALNLKESGLDVCVAEAPASSAWKNAEEADMDVKETPKAVEEADIIMMLVPDQMQKEIYESSVAPHLKEGNTLAFAHGFNIHYKQIVPPDNVNVMMIAPKGPGHLVRRTFKEGSGVPCLIAIHQDYSGNTKDLALAWAKGIGGTRAGVIETTFKDETETDLFGEQVVLCGGLTALIKAGFETLVKAGYSETMAYFECMHEVKLIVDLMYEGGMTYMRHSISNTAEYGDLTRGERIINKQTRMEMTKILKEVQSGKFAKEWVEEIGKGGKKFKSLEAAAKKHPIEKIGKKLRKNMKWIDAK